MKNKELELRAHLWERGDYISYLEWNLMQKPGYPLSLPYKLMSLDFYKEQVMKLIKKEGKK